MSDYTTSTKDLKELLELYAIRPSFQRLSILKYLMEHRDHPSVDEIFKLLVQVIPTLSKTTVYNTLSQLTEKGVINALSIDDVEVKYDYADIPHAHFFCTKCGHINDIALESNLYNIEILDEHQVHNTQINFKGICNNCKQ